MIHTIEDLILKIKQFELNATVWGWNTRLKSTRGNCEWIRAQLSMHLDDFVSLSIARFGAKDLAIGQINLEGYSEQYIRRLILSLEDFLIDHIKVPQTEFSPDLEDVLIKMIRDLNKFIFEMGFE